MFSITHIKKEILDSIKNDAETSNKNEYPGYGDDCKHYIIDDHNFKAKIESILRIPLLEGNYEIRYIIYDFQSDYYYLDEHDDGCKKTYLFMLYKDENIFDDLYFEKYRPKDDAWNIETGGLISFDGMMNHGGIIKGIGKRIILAVHID